MFGSEILDVAIGMVFIYLLLSLVCSAINEIIEAWIKKRATDLEKGIRELLLDPAGTGVVQKIYGHPLVSGLFRGDYKATDLNPYAYRNLWPRIKKSLGMQPKEETGGQTRGTGGGAGGAQAGRPGAQTPQTDVRRKRVYRIRGFLLNRGGADLPSYIPSRNFALALMDTVMRGASAQGAAAANYTAADLRAKLDADTAFPSAEVNRALRSLIATTGDDINKVRESIERWYDSSMDRVSGWYKRRTQVIILFIGLGAAAFINADTLTIFKSLMNDPPLRNSLVAAAEAYASSARSAPASPAPTPSPDPTSTIEDCRKDANSPECRVQKNLQQMEKLGLPIGWDCRDPRALPQCVEFSIDPRRWNLWALTWGPWLLKLFGWTLTAVAVSLGSSFWFDLLNKFMVVRSTVKPHEKSPEEKPIS